MSQTVTYPPPNTPYAGMTSPAVVLAMIQVKQQVTEITKGGTNEKDRYDYVRAIDLWAALQQAEAAAGLVISPRLLMWKIESKVLVANYMFDAHHTSGEAIYNLACVAASCRFEFKSGTTDDKSFGKVLTYAAKQAHLHLYKIPTDDAMEPDLEATGLQDDRPRNDYRRDARRDERDRAYSRDRDTPDDDRRERHAVNEPPAWSPPADDPPPPASPDDYDGGPRKRPEPAFDPGPEGLNRPPETADEASFRDRVRVFKRALEDARTEDEAARLWGAEAALIEQLAEVTYNHLRAEYHGKWDIYPPSV